MIVLRTATGTMISFRNYWNSSGHRMDVWWSETVPVTFGKESDVSFVERVFCMSRGGGPQCTYFFLSVLNFISVAFLLFLFHRSLLVIMGRYYNIVLDYNSK